MFQRVYQNFSSYKLKMNILHQGPLMAVNLKKAKIQIYWSTLDHKTQIWKRVINISASFCKVLDGQEAIIWYILSSSPWLKQSESIINSSRFLSEPSYAEYEVRPWISLLSFSVQKWLIIKMWSVIWDGELTYNAGASKSNFEVDVEYDNMFAVGTEDFVK